MLASPEAIFFDAAGTLLTVAEPVGESYSRLAAQCGLIASPERVAAGFRKAWKNTPDPLHPMDEPPADDDASWWRMLVERTFAHALDELPHPDAMESTFRTLYAHFAKPEAWVLYPDTRPALDWLKGRSRLLVLSNFDTRLLGLLHAFELNHYFEATLLSSRVGASKPHPRMFQAALQHVGLAPQRCYHVGDDADADAAGAEQMDLPFWLVQRPGADLLQMCEQWGMT